MKRRYAIASLAVMAANLRLGSAKAQTQVVSNTGQVVSTGDVVIRQSAGGQQYVYDADTDSWQSVSNDLQVVSTGNVVVDQVAAGESTFMKTTGAPACTPGEYSLGSKRDCFFFCTTDCNWSTYCCSEQSCRKGRCGK